MANYKYRRKYFPLRNSIEVEENHKGNYGAKGQKRKDKKKATQEDIERQNQWNAEKNLRRLINNNFGPDDWHMVLTYEKDKRLVVEAARKAVKRFLAAMRRDFKKLGYELKYIMVTEYENKAIHHHIVIQNIIVGQTTTAKLVKKNWEYGRPKFVPMDDTGEYKDLAEYLIKETSKTFKKEGNPNKLRYTRSRNLEVPEPIEEDMYKHEFKNEPEALPGYYIDKDSVVEGENKVSGKPYRYYTMIRLRTASDHEGIEIEDDLYQQTADKLALLSAKKKRKRKKR
ncbi:hypothetical protein [Murimonas intestini]|uniref:Replication-associated protein ORF2/G2P domain-containing protein n=1 Tax=Murimonas intestini TaxID=1337051 RepID=A0AB73SZE8_9FIRM|nr:hypothetical protein [Murimonas intestini]MCR1842787.1 hypothetical protein [Murimonas intestini]MCR1867874.1 hypothetical protein [Murimonas intestini]MCR1885225.1 hypothetical protein [Murimonas intestini]